MKLLIISPLSATLQSEFYAPVEKHVRQVANELVKRNHDVTVAALKGSTPELFKLIECPNTEGAAFNVYKDQLKDYEAVLDFSNLKYSYVHKYEKEADLHLFGACYPYQAMTYQTAPPIPFPCFIATSDAMAQAMSAKLGCAFKTVHYFISPVPADFEVPKEKGPNLLFLGRLEKGKGVQEAIDVARQTRSPLDIAGEDVLITDQRFTVLVLQKADGKLIKVYGRVTELLKHQLLAKAKALILPYVEDPPAWTCQTILEAFQHGTPVITMNHGAVKEFVQDGVTGTICDRLDELPEAVKELDALYPEKCVETAKQFTVETAVDKYLKLLTDLSEW